LAPWSACAFCDRVSGARIRPGYRRECPVITVPGYAHRQYGTAYRRRHSNTRPVTDAGDAHRQYGSDYRRRYTNTRAITDAGNAHREYGSDYRRRYTNTRTITNAGNAHRQDVTAQKLMIGIAYIMRRSL
jgi:hypothetical protein